MKWRKLLLCLALVLAACSAITALADAAVEDFWNYSYAADRSVYINTSDGLGIYMRYGPGTEYGKVNSRTIPNGTTIHITQECTASNGWKWGYCSYTFPGQSYADSGWICLVETTTARPAASAPAAQSNPASQARAVDRVLYIKTADGLGLYMRVGPGTNYSKVNSRTIPNGTAIHITQEITAANGWNWGWCSYQFPGRSTADSGWCCLVETTTQAPTAQPAAPVQTQPEPVPEPAPVQEEAPAEEPQAEQQAQTAPVEEAPQAEVQQAAAPVQAPTTYNSMLLVIIGVLIGIIAAAAILFIVTRGKK